MKKYLGLFDSGLGGLTVLKEIRKESPNLNIIYFGDNKNAPYGQKSQEEIRELTKKAFIFLKEKQCNKIVTACNSVSIMVNRELAEEVGIKIENIIEMSEATIKYCLENKLEKILVLSTEATKKAGLYSEQFLKEGVSVKSVAVNDLVDLVEKGADENEVKEKIVEQLNRLDLKKYQNVILACTHFPLVEDVFKKVFSGTDQSLPRFINPAIFVAQKVAEKFGNDGEGEILFHFSKDSKVTNNLIKDFLK